VIVQLISSYFIKRPLFLILIIAIIITITAITLEGLPAGTRIEIYGLIYTTASVP
jgi:hypothetical protein